MSIKNLRLQRIDVFERWCERDLNMVGGLCEEVVRRRAKLQVVFRIWINIAFRY
jgi:hypothetical protein